MFRTALLRSFKVTAPRAIKAPITPRFSYNISNKLNPAINSISSIRAYSHAPELTKEIITERIIELLEGFDKIEDKSKIVPSATFSGDLNLDSLDIVEVVMAIEEEFSITVSDEEADSIKSVQQAIDLIAAQPDSA